MGDSVTSSPALTTVIPCHDISEKGNYCSTHERESISISDNVAATTTPIVSNQVKENRLAFLLATVPRIHIDSTEKVNDIVADLQVKYHHQPIFLQAVQEMARSIQDLLNDPLYYRAFVMMTEPERTISFRVLWMDDSGQLQVNRGWRIEFNRYEYLYHHNAFRCCMKIAIHRI
jgi:hypothetical protein